MTAANQLPFFCQAVREVSRLNSLTPTERIAEIEATGSQGLLGKRLVYDRERSEFGIILKIDKTSLTENRYQYLCTVSFGWLREDEIVVIDADEEFYLP